MREKLGIIYSCSFVIFPVHERKVNINNSEELFWTLNNFRREILNKISFLEKKYEKSGYI